MCGTFLAVFFKIRYCLLVDIFQDLLLFLLMLQLSVCHWLFYQCLKYSYRMYRWLNDTYVMLQKNTSFFLGPGENLGFIFSHLIMVLSFQSVRRLVRVCNVNVQRRPPIPRAWNVLQMFPQIAQQHHSLISTLGGDWDRSVSLGLIDAWKSKSVFF